MNGPRKLDFLCLGPQRTASSWLQQVLEFHDEICLPKGVKETMFFDKHYAKGLAWYQWHFEDASPGTRCGEIAPTYFDSPEATSRVFDHFPELKLIVLIRNPIERTHSLYRHHLSKGRIRCKFDEALDRFPNLISSGKYSIHCPRWESQFGRSNFLYLRQEDVSERPQAVLNEVCDFLSIARMDLPSIGNEKVNSATAPRSLLLARLFSLTSTMLRSARLYNVVNAAKRLGLKSVFSGGRSVDPMSATSRKRLAEEFDADVSWLENRLGCNLSGWRLGENRSMRVPGQESDLASGVKGSQS